jgi:DNA replication and repair protein RecF
VHLTRLALTDFRSYSHADVELQPGISTFIGPNGAGKTNLVEAAAYPAGFASHRVSSDAALVRHGASRAIVRTAVASSARDTLIEVEINPGRANRVQLNRVILRRPREALGLLRCVVFSPDDLAIVKGEPDQRRRYLDELLAALRPRYAGVRADYERVIRQRTALLKSARAAAAHRGARTGPLAALDAWDEQLIVKGAELAAGRLWLTGALRPHLTRCYAAVSGRDTSGEPAGAAEVTASYRQPYNHGSISGRPGPQAPPDAAELEKLLREALAAARSAELDRAACLVGPHRDDLELGIRGLPARGYASHGESWSLALAMRLAARELLRSDGEEPVLILDDVFAELDTGRRDRLARFVATAEQVLVTAAVPADVPESLAGVRFEVAEGSVRGG